MISGEILSSWPCSTSPPAWRSRWSWLLRPAVRRRFGFQAAYALWLAVPLAIAGALNPLEQTSGPVGPLETAKVSPRPARREGAAVSYVWGLGSSWSKAALVAWRYLRFLARVRAGRAGPRSGVFAPPHGRPCGFLGPLPRLRSAGWWWRMSARTWTG